MGVALWGSRCRFDGQAGAERFHSGKRPPPSQTRLRSRFRGKQVCPRSSDTLQTHFGAIPAFCACLTVERSETVRQLSKYLWVFRQFDRSRALRFEHLPDRLPGIRFVLGKCRQTAKGALRQSATALRFNGLYRAVARRRADRAAGPAPVGRGREGYAGPRGPPEA